MNDPQYINPLKHYIQKWPNIFLKFCIVNTLTPPFNNILHDRVNEQCSHHIETCQLNFSANDLTVFSMMETLMINGLKACFLY